MFTGIIEEVGTVASLVNTGSVFKLQVCAPLIGPKAKPGQSVALNGACLTVVEREQAGLSFEVMPETIKCTNLGRLKPQDKVNLEQALRVDGRFDGHLVSGHIDGTGTIKKRQQKGGDIILTIETLPELLRYIVLKGAVALDGVSLTISWQDSNCLAVNLIPYTLKNTTLGAKKEQDLVNIECDILAKYMDKLLTLNKAPAQSQLTQAFLREHGFTP